MAHVIEQGIEIPARNVIGIKQRHSIHIGVDYSTRRINYKINYNTLLYNTLVYVHEFLSLPYLYINIIIYSTQQCLQNFTIFLINFL
jgi:hypothetical protein